MVFIGIQRKKRTHAKIYDRTVKHLVFDLWVKPQTNGFHEFVLLFSIGSFTADGGLLQPTGMCKDNTSKDRFCSVR